MKWRSLEESIVPAIVAILIAAVVGDLLILSFGQSPSDVFRMLLAGTWGNAYGFGQVLESFVLTPRMVGERIGLHPLAVIFALLAFGELFGFAGVLLALPASAVLMVAFRHLAAHYLRSSFYNA